MMERGGLQVGTNHKTIPLLAVLLLLLCALLTEINAASRHRSCSGGVGAGGGCRSIGRRRTRNKRNNLKCSESSVAEYRLTFHGVWSEDRFPRMYPRRRPPAQWSKLVGRSHDSSYYMWSLGQKADDALKGFAERGDSSLYDNQPQGYKGVFDTFSSEPIASGEGWTSTYIMADGLHSRVSLIAKLVPSPDWFVGLDNLDLCRRGRWRPRAHVNLRPVDGGTDRGYTFTSPNWPSTPQEPVHQITSSFPDHPASAFLYDQYRRLPRIAFVDIERVAQYFRKGPVSPLKFNRTCNLKVFKKTTPPPPTPVPIPGTTSEVINGGDIARNEVNPHIVEPNPDFAAAHTLHYTMLDQRRFPMTTIIGAPTPATHGSLTPAVPTKTFHNYPAGISGRLSHGRDVVLHHGHSNNADMRQTSSDFSLVTATMTPKRLFTTMDANPEQLRDKDGSSHTEPVPSQSEHTFDEPQFLEVSVDDSYADSDPVDCIVAEWSQWSSCSKSCGFGVQTRSRDVLAYSRNAGMACPLLEQEVLCGSMSTCKWNHFSFLSDQKQPRRVRRLTHISMFSLTYDTHLHVFTPL
ncbi:hypothetical protein ACOMHN_050524 [Nucella lapillus]